jgi:hypothetical protein
MFGCSYTVIVFAFVYYEYFLEKESKDKCGGVYYIEKKRIFYKLAKSLI